MKMLGERDTRGHAVKHIPGMKEVDDEGFLQDPELTIGSIPCDPFPKVHRYRTHIYNF